MDILSWLPFKKITRLKNLLVKIDTEIKIKKCYFYTVFSAKLIKRKMEVPPAKRKKRNNKNLNVLPFIFSIFGYF